MTPLDRWLDTATHGLAPEAARRVGSEYRAAYQDATDAGEVDVLAAWGDPLVVNRQLRHLHLTTTDLRWLATLSRSDPPTPQERRAVHWTLGPFLLMVPLYAFFSRLIFSLDGPQSVVSALIFLSIFVGLMLLQLRSLDWPLTLPQRQAGELLCGMLVLSLLLFALLALPWPVALAPALVFALGTLLLLALGVAAWSAVVLRKVWALRPRRAAA